MIKFDSNFRKTGDTCSFIQTKNSITNTNKNFIFQIQIVKLINNKLFLSQYKYLAIN